jgi:hypothetical protein
MSVLKRLGSVAAVGALTVIGIAAAPHDAKAWVRWGFGVYVPPPVVYAPPPPVYVAPPVVYAPPPPVYYAPPRRVWVPPHWSGPYWVPGHWS